MAVYGPGCHPQNIIWTEAVVKPINQITIQVMAWVNHKTMW
jgi:hypothetical protein